MKERKLTVIVLFEARDAAGKGSTIKAITEKVIRLPALILPLKALVFGRH